MPPIPAALQSYIPSGLALVIATGFCIACRAKARQGWLRPGLASACLIGWAALEPLDRLRAATLAPPPSVAMLILPAAAVTAIELLRRWRAGRNDRLLSIAAAGLVGWWLARTTAGPADFWRVAILTAGLVGLLAWIVRQQPGRTLAVALALWGGLALTGGPPAWPVAVAATAAVAIPALAAGANTTVPSALLAVLLAGLDLSRGRLARLHVDAIDLVCLLALAAPVLAALIEPRLGKRWFRLAPPIGAAAAVALGWGLRRAFLG